MSDITYSAVNAAAEYQFGIDAALLGIDAARIGQAWDDAKPAVKHAYRESVRGAVAAAAPVIEAAVRAQIAAQIEAARDREWTWDTAKALVVSVLTVAARIARGES